MSFEKKKIITYRIILSLKKTFTLCILLHAELLVNTYNLLDTYRNVFFSYYKPHENFSIYIYDYLKTCIFISLISRQM